MSPGTTVRPPSSMTLVRASARWRISVLVPAAKILPSRIATAWTIDEASSSVMTLPSTRITSAASGTWARADARPAAMVNVAISTRRFVIVCFLRGTQTIERSRHRPFGVIFLSIICRHLGQDDIPIWRLQAQREAIGDPPGLLPSDVLGAQPESVGQQAEPSPSTACGGGRGSHAIESTGRIFMRKTLWLTAAAALALVAQS